MLGAAILWVGLATVGAGDYLRPFAEKTFDQATLEAETFGDKVALSREKEGLRVALKPGQPETGWKTPQALKIGGDCLISATIQIRKLPKPAQEDGAALGLAVSTQNLDQPEATLLRQIETDGRDVYRAVEKLVANPNQPQVMMNQMVLMNGMGMGNNAPDKPAKPVRHTFPSQGNTIRLEFRRDGQTLRYQVFDGLSTQPREIGQYAIGSGDIAGVKLFVSNRNATEPVDVLFQDLTIHANRLSGLGTAVRTVYGMVYHGEPTRIEDGKLVVGGPAPPPPAGATPPPAAASPPSPPPAVEGALNLTVPRNVVIAAAPAAAAPARAAMVLVAPAAPAVRAVAAEAPKPAAPSEAVKAEPAKQDAPATPPTPEQPKATLPMAEVASIAFERAAVAGGRFLGQPNVDTTGSVGTPSKDEEEARMKKLADDVLAPPPGTVAEIKVAKVDPKPNGIRDMHLSLSGLRPSEIKQAVIQCPTDKGQASWQLDTTGSQAWPLTIRRAGLESWADVFLEPPEGDCNGKDFAVTVTFADGQNAAIQIKADKKTDPKLAFDANAPAPALDARVFLADDEQLYGKLEAISEESLGLTTPWGDRLDIPMNRVVGVYMGMPDHKETPESFAKRLKNRGAEDVLLARNRDGEIVVIGGVIEAAKENKLTFNYNGKGRSLPLKMVEGLILASRPAPKPPTEVRPTFSLDGGIAVSGKWVGIEATEWKIETPWGQPLKLPVNDVRSVRFRGGEMTYLSDLEPSKVEETPYFGRRVPYRKDVSLDGGPLKLDGLAIEKGLAVHSRTALTYDLDGRFATFEVLLGFDEAARKKGRVDCRVFADGKEIYAHPDLRGDAPPVVLKLAIAGVEQIQLVVDFGADQDVGDRVIWGNARVYRKSPPDVPQASAPAPTTPPASGR